MQYIDECVGFLFLYTRRLPEDATMVPKHVGVSYLHELYFS
jgi:hypothetical protein